MGRADVDQIKTCIRVTEDHAFAGQAPVDLPAGEREAMVPVASRPDLRPSEVPGEANIMAAMLAHEMGRRVTFSAADFRRFATLIDIEGHIIALPG